MDWCVAMVSANMPDRADSRMPQGRKLAASGLPCRCCQASGSALGAVGSERVCCRARQGRGRAARGAAAVRAAAAPGQPGARRGGPPKNYPYFSGPGRHACVCHARLQGCSVQVTSLSEI